MNYPENVTRLYVGAALDLFGNFLRVLSDSQTIGVGAYSHSLALKYLREAHILGLAAICVSQEDPEE